MKGETAEANSSLDHGTRPHQENCGEKKQETREKTAAGEYRPQLPPLPGKATVIVPEEVNRLPVAGVKVEIRFPARKEFEHRQGPEEEPAFLSNSKS